MADKPISQDAALTSPATGDLIPIIDISEPAAADKNKSVTISVLTTYFNTNLSFAATTHNHTVSEITDLTNGVEALTTSEVSQLTNIGTNTIAAANWTAVANLSGTNSGDNAVNSLYSGLVSDTGVPAMLSSGGLPVLNTGITATEYRSAIGAGTSSTVGTVTSVSGTGTVSGLTLTGTVTNSGNLTLGGAITGFATGTGSATGINTGDQTSLTGISDTKANFNTALSDGTFMFTEVATLNDLAGVINSFATLTDGQVLTYDTTNGWQNETPAAGDVSKVGTPADNQLGVWTGDGTLEGTAALTWNNVSLAVAGNVTSSTMDAATIYPGNGLLTDDDTFYLGASSATLPVIQFDTNDNITYNRTGNNFSFSIGGFGVFSLSATTADFQDLAVTTTGDITANNLSGNNTGDQTSIVGISGTKANFNTALSDGSFFFSGDTLAWTSVTSTPTTLSGYGISDTQANFNSALSDGSFAFSGGAFHNGFSDYVANQHIDWTNTTSNLLTTGTAKTGDLTVEGADLYIKEKAYSATSLAGYGHIWVENTAPTKLWYRDDQGNDHELGGKTTVIDSTPAVDHTVSGTITSFTNGQGSAITFGQAVYISGSNTVSLADANTSTTMPVIGIVAEASVSAAAQAEILLFGIAEDATWAWTPGAIIYASGTAGGLTATAPTASGDTVQVVGVATHADRILINPSLDQVVLV